MKKPLFSIIIPIYNAEKYLEQCLASVRHQKYQNYEVIMIDDGSMDSSGDICNKYSETDSRFKVVHKKNGGVTNARKSALSIATGDYIVCIDSDDWISEDYLLKFKEEIELNDADIICCGYYSVKKNKITSVEVSCEKKLYDREAIRNEIFPILVQTETATYFRPSLWAKVFKKELFKVHYQNINDRITVGEDGLCVITCIYFSNSISIIKDCLYYYRETNISITRKRKPFAWEYPKLIANDLSNLLSMDEYDFESQINRKTVHELFNVICTQFYQDKTYVEIVNDINQNLKDECYSTAIERAKFSHSIKAIFMHIAIKKKLYCLIKIYAMYIR